MGMLTIVTWSVQPDGYMPKIATQATLSAQPDGHAYDCHTVGPARWACLQLPHRLHCRSSQMGMLTIATQATLSVQPDGHAYYCHSGYNFGSARSVGRFSQTGMLTIAARAGQSSQTGMLMIAAGAGWSSQTGMLTIAARAG